MRISAESPEARVATKNRVRALIFFALALVAGLAGLVLFMRYMDRIKAAIEGTEKDAQTVVLAAFDLPIATRLDPAQLVEVRWPRQHVPEGTYHNISEVAGRTLRVAMLKGEAVLRSRLANEKDGQGMAALLEPGLRAITVRVDAVVGVAGFVKPGDYVDLVSVMTPDEESKKKLKIEANMVSKIVLQGVRVIAVGEHLDSGGRQPVKVSVVTFAVTPQETEIIALATKHGTLQLILRSPVDQEGAATTGVTPIMLLTPDENAPVLNIPDPTLPPEEQKKERIRTRKKRPTEVVIEEEKPEEKPASSTVEIYRGNKIESRKVKNED